MKNKRKIKVTVLLGGDSAEREVSIASGTGVARALSALGHEVRTLDPALPLECQGERVDPCIGGEPPGDLAKLPPEKVFEWAGSEIIQSADVVFVGLHGGKGEDGTVQAVLDMAGVKYTGTGMLGSALAMDKDRSKALFNDAGVNTAPHMITSGSGDVEVQRIRASIEKAMGFPVIIKPNNQGSSIGFSFVPGQKELPAALKEGSRFGRELMVEKYIPGREVTVAVLEGTALPVVEIIPKSGFYDYRSKYTKGTSRYEVPAKIDEQTASRLKREAMMAYKALLCRDYARVDFRLSPEGDSYCLEVNTLPGMTGLSLVPMAALENGMTFEELVEKICFMALDR
ncbi:MAG: D-alanine--D-alanine ligase [Candidatus Krumholzibacteriota bacterium]|nr:D-alanine--D-alanine ligase [Candidatus Krumholzibacteriota bacterium]